MEEDAALNNVNQSKQWNNLRPRPLSYYLRAARAPRRVGSLATKGFFQVKEFLKKEIPLGSSASVSGFRPKASDNSRKLSNPLTGERPNTPSTMKKVEKEKKENSKNEDLSTIVKKSNEVLAEATTVFPFTLFPDTITLDRKKLVITQRTFFMSGKVLTIQIEEILNITVNVGPIFGSLHIAIRGLTSEDHFDIRYLWRKDAVHLKHIIEGYIIALKDGLDTERLPKSEAVRILTELGQDSNPEQLDKLTD